MKKEIVFATWPIELEAQSVPFEHELQAPARRKNDQICKMVTQLCLHCFAMYALGCT